MSDNKDLNEDPDLDSRLHIERENEDGSIHYDGVLGSFDYDPDQFELNIVEVAATEDFPAGQYEVLRYIGSETNGNRITIPEGITNTSMMFMNTDITCMPKIPSSVESADSMFSGCESMKVAVHPLPDRLKDANFMFFGCKNLENGPIVIPGTAENTNFMFANCESLKNTPKLLTGIKSGEFMFGNCKSLSKAPNIPNTMQEYSGMTYSCSGIDADIDASNEARMAKQRAKLESKLNKKTFGEKIGSGFGAIMQCHAMRQAGYGFIMAPIMTHIMRKNGSFDKSLSGGLAVSSIRRGGLSGVLLAGLAGKLDRHGENVRNKSREKLANFDNMDQSVQGSYRSNSLKVMRAANKDVSSGLFTRIQHMSATEKIPYQERYGGSYKTCEKIMNKAFSWPNDQMKPTEKHAVSEWYQKEVAACVAYYGEAERAIKASYKGSDQVKAMQGLHELSKMQLDPLIESIERAQKDYQCFNDGDIRNIARMVKDMPSEQSKPVDLGSRMMSNSHIMESMTKQRAAFVKNNVVPNNPDVNPGVKSDQKRGYHGNTDKPSSGPVDRRASAEAMFGLGVGQKKPSDDMSFGM